MTQNILTDFAYDQAGRLIGEYSVVGNLTSGLDNLLGQPSGNAITTLEETVWLGNLPLATIQNGTPYYIYTDQLGTPRQIDDGNGAAVWAWDTQTFGDNAPAANPGNSLLGIAFSYNPRFPGQYADAESGLFHNNARDYNPATGRYVESDPIGLMGGINTYAYVGGNPISFTDPTGNDPIIGATVGAIAGGVYGGIGAYLAGGDAADVVVSAATGAAIGGLVGSLDPSFGIATLAIIGGGSAGIGDITGQVIAQSLQGEPVNINYGSTLGAVLGGALGGAGSAALAPLLEAQTVLSEFAATAAAASLTSGPGTFLPAVGADLVDLQRSRDCP